MMSDFFKSLGTSEAHKAARAKALHWLGPDVQTACGIQFSCWYPQNDTALTDDGLIGVTVDASKVFGCRVCELRAIGDLRAKG